MAHFIVTFRIGSGSGYQERYDSFVAAVIALAGGTSGKVWDETTSLYIFEVDGYSAEQVAAYLNAKSKFDTSKDIVVVIDVDAKKKAIRGKLDYEVLLTSYLGF